MKLKYDYSKLLGRIKEKIGNNSILALRMGISERTMSLKLNGKIDFKQKEIAHICNILDIPNKDIASYFFVYKTQ